MLFLLRFVLLTIFACFFLLLTQGGTRELSLIAEDCIAMLRGELEIICFYFLSSLAHIKFVKPETSSNASAKVMGAAAAPTGKNPRTAGDGGYGRSRQSFVMASGDVVHTGDEVNSGGGSDYGGISALVNQYIVVRHADGAQPAPALAAPQVAA